MERIPESIIQAKKRIDRLEDQTQEILGQKQQAREELDTILQDRDTVVAELEKYRKEIPSIKRIKELEIELDEEKKLNEQYESSIIGLTKELNDARLEAAKFEGYGIETNARCKDYARRLSLCLDKVDKLVKVVNEKLTAENRELKVEISNIRTADKQLAKKDGQIPDE